jgi:hypothetical protein
MSDQDILNLTMERFNIYIDRVLKFENPEEYKKNKASEPKSFNSQEEMMAHMKKRF